MKKVMVAIEGVTPLIMHSSNGADPTNTTVKEIKKITQKGTKKRTTFDEEELDRLSFEVSIYHNGKFVYIPDTCMLGCIRDGAKHMKAGKEVTSGTDVEETEIALLYDGPKTIDELYKQKFVDRRIVKVGQARILRVRPRFNQWALKFHLLINPSVISPDKVKAATEYAGLNVGLLDYRPRFGRFSLKEWKEV